jgi:hypothetical protein
VLGTYIWHCRIEPFYAVPIENAGILNSVILFVDDLFRLGVARMRVVAMLDHVLARWRCEPQSFLQLRTWLERGCGTYLMFSEETVHIIVATRASSSFEELLELLVLVLHAKHLLQERGLVTLFLGVKRAKSFRFSAQLLIDTFTSRLLAAPNTFEIGLMRDLPHDVIRHPAIVRE